MGEQDNFKVAVIGTGTMGKGIALSVAKVGIPVHIYAKDDKEQSSCMEALHLGELGECLSLEDGLDGSYDFVIEAIIEDFHEKCSVLGMLSRNLGMKTVICTNTSSLSVTSLSHSVVVPQRFIGLHFFNPAHKIDFVEICVLPTTSAWAEQRTAALATKMGKRIVYVGDNRGFIVNKVLFPMLAAAVDTLDDKGYDVETIDRSMVEGAKMPLGPFKLLDIIGIDVAIVIMENLGILVSDVLLKKKEEGKLGRKTGEGFYKYESGSTL